jgi:hypothetical protein
MLKYINNLSSNHYLYDLVYNPSETLFLKKGEEQGVRDIFYTIPQFTLTMKQNCTFKLISYLIKINYTDQFLCNNFNQVCFNSSFI